MKKALSLVLVFCWVLSITISVRVWANDDSHNFIIEEREDYVLITGYNDAGVKELYVPGEINGKKVILKARAFENYDSLEKIVFGEGIETISAYLCRDCDNLKYVEISKGVTSIDAEAFSGCGNLIEVKHEGTVKTIGVESFYAAGLKEFDFTGVEVLGRNAFMYSKLEKVYLPDLKIWDGIADDDVDEETNKYKDKVIAYYPLKASEFELWEKIGAPFMRCNELKEVKIRYPEGGSGSYKSLFIDCINIETVIYESFPKEPGKWEFYNTEIESVNCSDAGNGYSQMRPGAAEISQEKILVMVKPDFKFTIYGEGSLCKAYAEKLGVPFGNILERDENEITIAMDNKRLTTDTAPYIKNDRTMVPMRAIFEALGAEVSWDNETMTAIGVKDGVEVKITIGEDRLYKNGEAVQLDAAAEITNDRTMVPVRAISEAFGCNVDWDNETKTVKITN